MGFSAIARHRTEALMNDIQSKSLARSRAIRLPEVCDKTGASRATVWRWVKNDPSFPLRFQLSAGITCWDEGEILAWIETKKAARTHFACGPGIGRLGMRGAGPARTPAESADTLA
jgi:predicted DNA-binding transcriptional regulator AlpA